MPKILLIDDDVHLRRSLKFGLEQSGYDVTALPSGGEALRWLDASGNRADLVITDYSMPEIDGVELLQRMKTRFPLLPVILITAYGSKDVVIEALNNQCDGYVEKPFQMTELVSEIERVLDLQSEKTRSKETLQNIPKIVHQINNPLLAITGNAELGLLKLHDQQEVEKHLKSILMAARLVDSCNREIMKVGRSLFKEGSSVFNLVTVIEESLHMFEGVMQRKDIAVRLQHDVRDVPVRGKREAFLHSINNLVMNAIEAMDGISDKQLLVSIGCNRKKKVATVTMEDSGCGISEDTLATIFEPYVTTKEKGTGLGLAIVKNTIEASGGTMRVSSTLVHNTVFTIEVPCYPTTTS